MDELNDIITHATAAIAEEYFLLPVHDEAPVYRERVYCYELYHQMRRLWPETGHYFLNGEVDKQRHPYFREGGYPKPDFLVHVPGKGENYAAIEVKPPGASRKATEKDIGTLLRFRQWYERALYLVYGDHPIEAHDRILACIGDAEKLQAIELWVHPEYGAPAKRIEWSAYEPQ